MAPRLSEPTGDPFDFSTLSERHAEVASLMLEGLPAPAIAQRSGLRIHAVDQIRKQVYAITATSTRAELAAEYTRYQWRVTYRAIQHFIEEHGHSRIPEPGQADHDRSLWSSARHMRSRRAWNADPHPTEGRPWDPFEGVDWESELDALQGWSWDVP